MILGAAGALTSVGLAEGLNEDGETGLLSGGDMALNEAYKVAEGVWIGPDSAKSNVPADSGNVYMASDTEVDYYGDAGSWTKRSVGSSAEAVPSVTTERADIADYRVDRSEQHLIAHRQRGYESPPTFRPHPSVSNPVITASDVTDRTNPVGVADPFVSQDGDGVYHLLAEVISDDGQDIAHWTSDGDLGDWTFDQTIITGANRAFPNHFKHDGEWYMFPDLGTGNKLEVWKQGSGWGDWSLVATPISGVEVGDPQPFIWDGVWYIISSDATNTEVDLRYADSLQDIINGNISIHPSSPISSTNDHHKGAGRAIPRQTHVQVPFQDKAGTRGGVAYYAITELSKSAYSDVRLNGSNRLAIVGNETDRWNGQIMHHIDWVQPGIGGQSFAVVDGQDFATSQGWSVGIHIPSERPKGEAKLILGADATVSGDGAVTALDFASYENKDARGILSGSGWFIPQTTGKYRFVGQVTWKNVGTPGQARIQLFNRSNTSKIAVSRTQVESDYDAIQFEAEAFVSAGDEIELRVGQDSTTSWTVDDRFDRTFLIGSPKPGV